MQLKVVQLQRDLPAGLCTVAHWTATKQDGDYTASAYGSLGLPEKDPSDPTFVAYEDITEAQAIEWVLAAMGTEQVEALEASLDAQINAARFPTSASGTPWASVAETPAEE
jgi:hypothetical protein